MAATGKGSHCLVVFRTTTKEEAGLLASRNNFPGEPHNKSSPRFVAAHLDSRFGPVIALVGDRDFHVHPSVSSSNRDMLRESMLGDDRTMIVLTESTDATDLSYKREAILSVSISYKPRLAQREKERNPELHLYLSDNVAHGVTILTDLSDDKRSERVLEIRLKMIRPTVPYDCLFNIQAYAQYKNESDQWCLNQCGYSNISLPVALRGLADDMYEQSLSVVNSDNPDGDSKGTVVVRVRSLKFADDGQDVPIEEVSKALKRAKRELSDDENRVRAYINENRKRCYESVPASSESIERVTVFTFQTQSHGFVPGAYFDVFRIPKSHVEFMINAIVAGRRRSHLVDRDPETSDDIPLLEFFRKASRRACLKVAMWAVGVYVTSCLYITDEVDHNKRDGGRRWSKKLVELMESFDNMITRDAGDCEDFSRAILVFVHALKRDYGVRAAECAKPTDSRDEVLLRMTDLLNGFVFCSGLCGVSTMALNDLKKEQKSGRVELNGHEAAFAIPRATFLKAVSRHDPTSKIAVYMTEEAARYPRYYNSEDIIYPIEGTGVLNPEPWSKTEDEQSLEKMLQAIAERSSMRFMEDARTLFTYNPKGANNFYKMFITLMTLEFMVLRGIPVVEFVLYERNEHRSSYMNGRHIGKRGVWFDELLEIGKNEHICLIDCPPFSVEMEAACTDLTKDNIPIWKPFEPLTAVPQEWIEYEKALGGPIKEGETDLRVNYFLPAVLVNAKSVDDIKTLAKSSGCKINCRLELIRQNPNGHKVGNFIVSFTKK